VRELALLPLVAVAILEKLADHRLWVDAKWHLLDLHGLEELGGLALGGFGGGLFLLALLFFGLLFLLLGRLRGGGCLLDLLDLLLCRAAFFLRVGETRLAVFTAFVVWGLGNPGGGEQRHGGGKIWTYVFHAKGLVKWSVL